MDTVNNGYNILPGGDISNHKRKLSSEHRLKISKANKGKVKHPLTDSTKAKISASKLGSKLSESTRRKMSKSKKGFIPWNKGIKASKEFGEKMITSHLGYKHKESSKLKISQNHRRCQTLETRKKLSIANTGYKHLESSKLKMSIAKTGKPIHTEESKKQISETLKLYWKEKKAKMLKD